MGGRAAPRLGLALVLVALAAARAHPLDRYHTVDADPATEQVVPGPGSVKKSSVRGATTDSGGDGAGAAIDAAVNSWQKDAHAATRLTDVNPDAAAPKRTDGGNTNDAVEAASHHHAEDENESPPSDAPAPAPTALAPSEDASTTHTTLNSSSATPSSVVDGGGGTRVRALRRVLRGLGRRLRRGAARRRLSRPRRVRRLRRAPGSNQRHVHDEKIGRPTSQARHGGVLRDGASRGDGGRVPAPFLKSVCIPVFRDTAPTAKPGNRGPRRKNS